MNKWKDLVVGQCQEKFYCLQVKRTKTGKIVFRVATHAKEFWAAGSVELEDLPKSPTKE